MPVDESAELQQLIMMSGHAPDDQVEDVLLRLSEAGSYGRVAPGRDSIVISAFGDPQMIHDLGLENVAGVERVLPVSKP
jgi:3-deoxy-7-phosphoheptulonate synthase